MAFSESEISSHLETIESVLWSRRRPPLHARDQVREGQRISGQSIVLFFVRSRGRKGDETSEVEFAKVTHVRAQEKWRLYWKRRDGKWHSYPGYPEAQSLEEALRAVDEDAMACFFR